MTFMICSKVDQIQDLNNDQFKEKRNKNKNLLVNCLQFGVNNRELTKIKI